MTRSPALGLLATAVLATAISGTSIALARNGGGPALLGLGGPPAARSVMGGDAGAPDGKRAATDMRIARPVTYRVEGALPELGGSMQSWRLASGEVAADRITALAKVFGVEGPIVTTEWGDWVVEGGTYQLTVSAQPGHPWYLSPRPVDVPMTVEPDVPKDAGASGGVEPGSAPDAAPVPMPEPVRPEGLPSRAEAERVGTAFLAKLGFDLASASAVRVDDGFSNWYVSASPAIGGVPVIGMDWSVGVGVDSVVEYANGWLDRPLRGDEYPLLGAAGGVEQLRAQRRPGVMSPLVDPAVVRCMDCPDAGPAEPYVQVITGVRLAYQVLYADLVPTYVFTTADGGEITAYAVDEAYLHVPEAIDGEPLPVEGMTTPAPVGKG